MSQVSSGRWAARHRPRHAQVSGLTLRAFICAALIAGLALAASIAGSDGPAAGAAARAAVPPANAAPAAGTVQNNPSSAGSLAGVEHSLATPGVSNSDAVDLGLAQISDRFPASGLAADGIPVTALDAYQNAAAREATRTPACGLTWPLLAGIGRVESDHGRFAGAVLHADGLSTPRVIGIPLDGHGTALIRDTDNGALDGDTVYDRAVGPMQFIPSTWVGWGVDANGDGVKDPFNIFDAAAAAADYLCAAGRDLTTTHGQVQAILSYNYSWDYVSMVMGLERVYASGAVGVTVPVLPTSPDNHSGRPKHKPPLPPVDPGSPAGVPTGGGKPKPKPTPSSTRTTSHPAPSTTATTPPAPSSSDPGSSSGSTSPSDPICPSDSGGPTATDSPSSTPSECASTSGSDSSGGQSPPLPSDVSSSDAPTS
jgi:membrane-bound lytic murein transglycosylase B